MVKKYEDNNGRNESDAERRRRERKSRESSAGGADWGNINPQLLAAVIAAVTVGGGAIRFGYTRDGGAYSVGLYGSGEPSTDYIRPNEDIEGYLTGVLEDYAK